MVHDDVSAFLHIYALLMQASHETNHWPIKHIIDENTAGMFASLLRDTGLFCATGHCTLLGTSHKRLTVIESPERGWLGRLATEVSEDDRLYFETHGIPSPFGYGEKTVVDSEVRSSLEIKAELPSSSLLPKVPRSSGWSVPGVVNLPERHPRASAVLAHVLQGFYGPVLSQSGRNLKLIPTKAVFYREGDHFDWHSDTPKGPLHMGTLVVVPWSKNQGGDFVLRLATGYETVMPRPPEDGFAFALFPPDRPHMITEVTQGRRVALLYDVFLSELVEPLELSEAVECFVEMQCDRRASYRPEQQQKSFEEHTHYDQLKVRREFVHDRFQVCVECSFVHARRIASTPLETTLASWVRDQLQEHEIVGLVCVHRYSGFSDEPTLQPADQCLRDALEGIEGIAVGLSPLLVYTETWSDEPSENRMCAYPFDAQSRAQNQLAPKRSGVVWCHPWAEMSVSLAQERGGYMGNESAPWKLWYCAWAMVCNREEG